jgi:hypothetical protein
VEAHDADGLSPSSDPDARLVAQFERRFDEPPPIGHVRPTEEHHGARRVQVDARAQQRLPLGTDLGQVRLTATEVLDTAFAPDADDRAALQTERARLVREIENLTTGIASGGDIPQLVTGLKDRDRRLKLLDARLAPKEARDREPLRLALEQRVADWRKILRSNAKQGRMVLQQLVGPLAVHSNNNRPSWLAQPRPEGLLVGMVQGVASPTGLEPVFWP